MSAILVVTRSVQPENRFGPYAGEMLKSEGIGDFEIVDVDRPPGWPELTAEVLLLTRCHLRAEEIDRILDYARQGGALVVFQPPWRLCDAVRIAPTYKSTLSGYLLPDADHAVTRGIPHESIQCHWPIERYDLSKASAGLTTLGRACKPGFSEPEHDAVLSFPLGSGNVILFFYDPPAAVARTRFGNPDLATINTLGFRRDTRSPDLFVGHFDPARGHLPQADLHCALVANAVQSIARHPVPRLWYYPRIEQRSALPMRSDDDWSTPEQFEQLREGVEKRGGRDTFYLVRDTKLPDDEVRRYVERGHSFSTHSNPYAKNEEPYFAMADILEEDLAAFRRRYGLSPKTTQVHSAYWRGYMDLIPVYHRIGFRMAVTVGSFLDWFGLFVAGTSRPMKFVDNAGRIYDVFQQPYVLYDDGSIKERLSTQADAEVAKAAKLLDACVNVHYSPLGFQSHPVSFATYAEPFIGGVMDEAQKRGVPVVSMEDWYAFTQARHDARVGLSSASEDRVECELAVGSAPDTFVVMLPMLAGRTCEEAMVDGEAKPVQPATVFGVDYATVQAKPKPGTRSLVEFRITSH